MSWVNVGGAVSGGATSTGPYASHAEVALKADNYTTATGSTTGRSMADRFADVVNVKDFGAKGDGVTDDTAAIASAIAALPSSSVFGGTLFLPGGRYSLGTTGLVIPAGKRGVKIVGSGRVGTYLVYTGSGNAVQVGTIAADTQDFYLSDLTIDVSGAAGGAYGIKAYRAIYGEIRNVWIQGRTSGADSGHAVDFDGTGNWTGVVHLYNVGAFGNFGTGFAFDGPGAGTANFFTLTGCMVARTTLKPGTGTNGMYWGANSGDGVIHSLDIEGYDTGLRVAGVHLKGNVRLENNAAGLAFEATASRNYVQPAFFLNTLDVSYAAGGFLNHIERGGDGVSGDRGDTSQTLTAGVDAVIQRWATALTANRTVTLSTIGAAHTDKFRVVRTGLGAFTLDVGGLRTIPSATAAFVDVAFDGTAWRLVAYGTL